VLCGRSTPSCFALFRDVYVSPDTELTPQLRAHAGWLWSGRRGIIAGLSASALHGAKWVDVTAPLEIIHANRNPLHGIRVRGDDIGEDEVVVIEGVPATTPSRTALDLGCWYPRSEAVAAIDALARATDLKMPDVDLLLQRTRNVAKVGGGAQQITVSLQHLDRRHRERGSTHDLKRPRSRGRWHRPPPPRTFLACAETECGGRSAIAACTTSIYYSN
jgi:hypothetical protein